MGRVIFFDVLQQKYKTARPHNLRVIYLYIYGLAIERTSNG